MQYARRRIQERRKKQRLTLGVLIGVACLFVLFVLIITILIIRRRRRLSKETQVVVDGSKKDNGEAAGTLLEEAPVYAQVEIRKKQKEVVVEEEGRTHSPVRKSVSSPSAPVDNGKPPEYVSKNQTAKDNEYSVVKPAVGDKVMPVSPPIARIGGAIYKSGETFEYYSDI